MEVIKAFEIGISVSRNRGIFGVLDLFPLVKKVYDYFPDSILTSQQKVILDDVSFRVRKGDIFGIIGFNGSGKTTLCQILSKLIPHDKGEVEVLSNITICNNELFGTFDALQNIQMGTRLFDLCTETVNRVALELLAKLGVNDKDLKTEADHLSFGTAAKIALVRAVIIALREDNPNPILILDEPTRGFDVKAIREFEASIHVLKALIPDLTIVIATNQEHELCLCDRYVALVGGKVVADESLLENLKKSYARHRDETYGIFEKMISGHQVGKVDLLENKELDIKLIPKQKKRENPFLWRARNEIMANPVFTLIFIFSMIVPNLFPILSAESKTWEIFMASVCGIYFSLLMRTSYRVLGREVTFFRVLNLIQVSKYRGLKHLFAATRSGLLQDTCYFVSGSIIMGTIYALQVGPPSFSELTFYDCFSLITLIASGVVFSFACGIICSPLLVGMKGENAFFLLSFVPMVILMLSGLYYPADHQILGFKYVSYLMPFTMLGDFLRGDREPLKLLGSLAVSLIVYMIALKVYLVFLKILFKAKRLKN